MKPAPQIALPLDFPQGEDRSRFIAGDANAEALDVLERWHMWPVKSVIVTGPRRSGRSQLLEQLEYRFVNPEDPEATLQAAIKDPASLEGALVEVERRLRDDPDCRLAASLQLELTELAEERFSNADRPWIQGSTIVTVVSRTWNEEPAGEPSARARPTTSSLRTTATSSDRATSRVCSASRVCTEL